MAETETIAKYLADLDCSSIPSKILEEMKVLLFDYLGVALGGTRTESGKIAAQFSKKLREKGEATIIGFGYRVSAPSAAFSNAILSHSIELDDVDSLAYFHFSPPIFSAALALAEREHATGRDLLVALTAGCDVMARLSSALNPSHRDRGFHTTAACGIFGAAAASAKLLHLDVNGVVNTLGLAGAQASGLMEFYGTSMQKRFNPGPAARGGVVSALLASMGFTGAETILEGDRGFLRAYSDQVDHKKLMEGLGKEFPIYIEYKPYSCARPIHNAIDCSLELRRKHGIDPNQISKITVFRHPRWANYHKINRPRTYHEAQVSLPYGVAVSFAEGKAFLQQYSDEKLRDPLVQRLSEMVEIQTVDGLARDVSCRMEIVLRDGSKYVFQVDYPRGSIENPMTPEEKREKFKSLSSGILDGKKGKRVEETVFRIEKVKDVSKLMELVIREGKRGG
ncbi:MAG: MmgE/PrpD family protein [Thermodesulfobacteriota bacterium]|nr:MmgE/PrpD family protein [Thermodesulfobacteriota bacterium]